MNKEREKQGIQVAFGDIFIYKSCKGEEQKFVILELKDDYCFSAQLYGDKKDTLSLLAGRGTSSAKDIHKIIGRFTLEEVLEAFRKCSDYPEYTDFYNNIVKKNAEENSKKPSIFLK